MSLDASRCWHCCSSSVSNGCSLIDRGLDRKHQELGSICSRDHPVADPDHPVDTGDCAQGRLELILRPESSSQLDNAAADLGVESRSSPRALGVIEYPTYLCSQFVVGAQEHFKQIAPAHDADETAIIIDDRQTLEASQMHLAGSQRDRRVGSNTGHLAAHGGRHVESGCPRAVKAVPPRFQNIGVRFALLSLVEEVSLRNDSDELSGAIDNGKPAHPIALEKAYRFLEGRLWRSGDDAPRHYLIDRDHGPIVAIANAAGLGRRASFA